VVQRPFSEVGYGGTWGEYIDGYIEQKERNSIPPIEQREKIEKKEKSNEIV
jgi:hypothetical protein